MAPKQLDEDHPDQFALAPKLIAAALADPRWDFRTVDGIARQTQLEDVEVQRALEDDPCLARKSVMSARDGRELYTSPHRRIALREWIEQLRWILAR